MSSIRYLFKYCNHFTFQLTGSQPVIIYLHPGGFTGGNGNNEWTGPQYFLDRDIVLVTTNYRLGPFGKYGYHYTNLVIS